MNTSPPMVLVEWVDSGVVHSGCAWGSIEDTILNGPKMTARPCMSVGYLVFQDDKCIVLVPHLMGWPLEDGDVGSGDMTIPLCSVIRICTLAVKVAA